MSLKRGQELTVELLAFGIERDAVFASGVCAGQRHVKCGGLPIGCFGRLHSQENTGSARFTSKGEFEDEVLVTVIEDQRVACAAFDRSGNLTIGHMPFA